MIFICVLWIQLWDFSRLSTWRQEKLLEEGKKPPAVIFSIEFRQIVKNSLALLKPLLKTDRKECPLTVKWI